MKKMILPILLLGIILGVGYFWGFDTLFLPGAVKKVRSDNVENLRKKADEAETRFKEHLESAEKAGNAWEKLGKKLLQKKDWSPAIESLEKAISYGSGGARAHFMLGQAYANRAKDLGSKKDIKKSLFHYRRALEKNSNLLDAEYGIALVYFYLQKEKDKGIKILQKLSRREPDFFQARFALGRFWYESGNPAKALSVYESLYSDLQRKKDSPLIEELRKNCKKNISRLMLEMSR